MVRKKRIGWFALILLMIAALPGALPCFGAETHVFDMADLFTSGETRRMEELAGRLEETYDMNILMLTADDTRGRSSAAFAENFYEDGGYDENGRDGGIVLLIDMDNRELNLVTNGSAIRYITDMREEQIYDAGYDAVSDGEYGQGMYNMLERTGEFLKQGIPENQYNYDPKTGRISRYHALTAGDFLLAAGAALLLAGACCFTLRRRYRVVEQYQYQVGQNTSIRVTDRQDRQVNEFVTSVHVPRERPPRGGGSFSGGGSGRTTVHTSSGGNSYGGGHGRKF